MARVAGLLAGLLGRLLRALADLPPPEIELVLAGRAGGDRAAPAALGLDFGEGRCPVCAGALDDHVVLCHRCLTPHHRGCFDWNRRCGVYACGAGRAMPLTERGRELSARAR